MAEHSAYRDQALSILIENARRVSERHEQEISHLDKIVKMEDGSILPGYAPYIGATYFSRAVNGRRMIALGMSQNLDGSKRFAQAWATSWKEREEGSGREALDRQNHEYDTTGGKTIAMNPFDTGHVPVLCAMLRACRTADSPVKSIYDEIAATNLSKFSFRDGAKTKDSQQSFKLCWDLFTTVEIDVLRPEFVLCLGRDVERIVSRGLPQGIKQINVVFPGGVAILPHVRWPDTADCRQDAFTEELLSMFTEGDLNHWVGCRSGESGVDSLRMRIEKDAPYFYRMRDRIHEAVGHDHG